MTMSLSIFGMNVNLMRPPATKPSAAISIATPMASVM